jgi:hypothetical protein
MNFRSRLSVFLRNDFVVTLFVLVAFLLTNRYIYGWDDQHLEIPLLKHLIDPQLFAGDYYVEALSRNFSSYLYPILSRVITVEMIPAVYLVLYCLVRFFFFFWVYRLWQWISGGDRLAALYATLGLFLLGRTEEFIYRTFSHEEFSLAIIFAGFYFFYRERFFLAALLFGIAANFHALYALFPMMFLAVYALFFVKDRGKTFFKAAGIFTIAALPFLVWHLPKAFHGRPAAPLDEWLPLYLQSCPQCFPLGTANPNESITGFKVLFERLYPYLFLTALYVAHCFLNQDFRRDRKAHIIFWVSALMIVLGFVFAYAVPNRFMLDLNLGRMAQFVHFMLMGYSVLFLIKLAQRPHPAWAFAAAVVFIILGLAHTSEFLSRLGRHAWVFAVLLAFLGLLIAFRRFSFTPRLKRLSLVIPLVWMFGSFGLLHYRYVQMSEKGAGFWQLQRNWEDMQFYVRDHTPKDAMILTPYDMEMGGFRIHSNRKVVVCYRDCGIIGFDYEAAKEWSRRIQNVEPFKVFSREDIRPALMNAVEKYGANYIVFMKYYEPQQEVSFLRKLYANDIFSLYQIIQ